MKYVNQAEDKLSGLFKDLPALPPSSKESLAGIMPWISLIFGVVQIAAAYWVWKLANVVDRLADVVNTYSAFYQVPVAHISAMDRTVIYLGALMLLADGVIGLVAFSELKKRSRRGWDLLFLAALLNVAYAVVSIFINGRGFGNFVMSLVGSAVGFYLLFQIREKYGKSVSSSHRSPAA